MKTVIEMAREAGFEEITSHKWTGYTNHLKSLIELVRADEREACAGLRKEIVLLGGLPTEYEEGFWDALRKYEDAIRARNNS